MPIVAGPEIPGRPRLRPAGPLVAGAPGVQRRRGPRVHRGPRPRPHGLGRDVNRAAEGRNQGLGRRKRLPWFLILGVLLSLPALFQVGRLLAENGPVIQAVRPAQHLVRRGETFTSIARENGVSVEELLKTGSNSGRFPNPNRIHPGQKVDLP